jgi:hypothetical protein
MCEPRVASKLVKELTMPKKKTYFKQVPVRVAKQIAKRAAEIELRKQKSPTPLPALKSRGFHSAMAAYVA